LKVPPYPSCSGIFASNYGGTATLIGDRPTSSSLGGASLLHGFRPGADPVCIVVLVLTAHVHLLWGRKLAADAVARARVMALDRNAAITDRTLMRKFRGGDRRRSLLCAGAASARAHTIALFAARSSCCGLCTTSTPARTLVELQ